MAPFRLPCGGRDIVCVSFLLALVYSIPCSAETLPDGGANLTVSRFGDFLALQTTIKPSQTTSPQFQPLFAGQLTTQHAVGMQLNTSFLNGALKGQGELQDNSQNTVAMGAVGGASDHRNVRVSVSAEDRALRYGMNYQTTGAAFGGAQDQGLQEAWTEWSYRIFRFRSALSQRWNNINRDPTRPRNETVQRKTSITAAQPNWPELAVSYTHDDYGTAFLPSGTSVMNTQIDRFETSLQYGKQLFSAKFMTSYFMAQDLQQSMRADGKTYAVQLGYHPFAHVDIIPVVSIRQDYQPSSATLTNTQSATLSISYKFRPACEWNTSGSIARMSSDTHAIQGDSSRVKTSVSWLYAETAAMKTTLLLDAGFSEDVNYVANNTVTNTQALLRLQMAAQ
ncbi:MAG TPA: hypothetical protein VJV04_04185 [Nitrospiraceae bacterium]|nr:hypothetical protein [Nitrospiraceae bacterium]